MLKNINDKGRQVIDWFRTTARSINNQFDSYYYVTAGSISGQALFNGDAGNAVKFFSLATAAREMVRGFAWWVSENAYIPMGASGRERDHKSLSLNAQAFALLQLEACGVGFQTLAGHPWPGASPTSCLDVAVIGIGLFISYTASLGPTGTGLTDVGSYSEVMWNYPGRIPERPHESKQLPEPTTNQP